MYLTPLPASSAADAAEKALRDPQALHLRLAHWNHRRMAVGVPSEAWREDLREEHEMRLIEGALIEKQREAVAAHTAEAPSDPKAFVAWFEALKENGPGQNDPLFPWLAEEASLDEIRWFLTQEAAGEAGFDDLVALSQIKLSPIPKLELAANYWDEMGRGHEGGMHGPMLDRTVKGLGLTPTIDGTVWQSLALANTLTAFATTRRYAYLSIGALGVVELTAPGRVACVAAGLKRHGCEPAVRKYFDLHAHLDVKHSADWNEHAIIPLVEENPACARFLAEGALIRLACGALCFDAYRAELWGEGRPALSA